MQFSDGEWKVMNAVWAAHPASVRDVFETLEDETHWAYSTVRTVLSRLADKGALSTRKRANTSLYEPLVSRGEARRSAFRALLDKAFDGTFGSLAHHLIEDGKLSRPEKDELRALILESESDRADGPGQ